MKITILRFFRVFLVLIISFGLSKNTNALAIDSKSGKVSFIAVGKPAMLKIKGEGDALSSELTIKGTSLSGSIALDLHSLKTGLDLRDDHMKNKYLEVERFPKAEIKFNDFILPNELSKLGSPIVSSEFKGILKLHGIEKPIVGIYSLERKNDKLKVNSKFTVNLSDFSVDIPSYAGIKVADKVEVETEFEVLP